MEGMSLKLIPVVVRHLGPLSMFGPMTSTALTRSNSPNKGYNLPLAAHPPPPLTLLHHSPHPLPPAYPLYMPLVLLQFL